MTAEDTDPINEPAGTGDDANPAPDAGAVTPAADAGATGAAPRTGAARGAAEAAAAEDTASPEAAGPSVAAAAALPADGAEAPLIRGEDVVVVAGMEVLADPEAERRRRRKAIILVGLLALLTIFSMFAGWYLITRKPISELPLPGISDETLPHYEFSIYGIDRPIGIVASPSGDRIYVAETAGDRTVIAYDGKGTEVARFVPPDSVPGSRIPVYVALDPVAGEVYVSDRATAKIYVYSPDGTYQRTFEPKPKPADWQPLGLAFDRAGQPLRRRSERALPSGRRARPRRHDRADDRDARTSSRSPTASPSTRRETSTSPTATTASSRSSTRAASRSRSSRAARRRASWGFPAARRSTTPVACSSWTRPARPCRSIGSTS